MGAPMPLSPDKALDMAEKLLELALDLAPVELLRARLDAAAVRRQNAIADTLEDIKFGPP